MRTRLFISLFLLFGTMCQAQEIVLEGTDHPLYEIIGNDTIFLIVEEAPEFNGGSGNLNNYLRENLEYPQNAVDNNLEGRVIIEFIINTDGTLSNIHVQNGIHESLEKEALRVVNSMPKWKPGKNNGKHVKVKYVLPINFTIPNMIKSDGLIAWQFISNNISDSYEFQIIDLEPAKKFDYTDFKNQYVTPTIMEDKASENIEIFSDIKSFVEENLVDSYITTIIRTREKGSDDAWSPEWYFLFLDANRNVLNIFYYYP